VFGITVIALSLSLSSADAQINNVIVGNCVADRQWLCNIEFDDQFRLKCVSGITCDGMWYNTCKDAAPNDSLRVISSSASISGSNLHVVVKGGTARVTLHSVFTGELIHDFGVIDNAGVADLTGVNKGMYILVTTNQESGQVTDSDMVLVE
jgi:hypothetical protein